MVEVLINAPERLKDFIRLNELWITHYFEIEEADEILAKNPYKVIEDGGYIFTLVINHEAIGVCALFKISDRTYQLARMAVAEEHQGKGYSHYLMRAVFQKSHEIGAEKINLLSNTKLVSAINLYKKYGFTTTSIGNHPDYKRVDIVMEKMIEAV